MDRFEPEACTSTSSGAGPAVSPRGLGLSVSGLGFGVRDIGVPETFATKAAG